MNDKEVELFVRVMLLAIRKEVKACADLTSRHINGADLTSKHINDDAYIALADAQNLRMEALAISARQYFDDDTKN